MDVFIPEEYVTRRRSEKTKAAAAGARKRSEMVVVVDVDSGRRILNEKKDHKPRCYQLQNECMVVSNATTGLGETIIFSCLSA